MGRRFYLIGMALAVIVSAIFGYQQGRSIDLFSDPFADSSTKETPDSPVAVPGASEKGQIAMIRGMTPVPPATPFPKQVDRSLESAEAEQPNTPLPKKSVASVSEAEHKTPPKTRAASESIERVTSLSIRPLNEDLNAQDGETTLTDTQEQTPVTADVAQQKAVASVEPAATSAVAKAGKPVVASGELEKKNLSGNGSNTAKASQPLRIKQVPAVIRQVVVDKPDDTVAKHETPTPEKKPVIAKTAAEPSPKPLLKKEPEIAKAEQADKTSTGTVRAEEKKTDNTVTKREASVLSGVPSASSSKTTTWIDVTGKPSNLATANDSGWVNVTPEKVRTWKDVTDRKSAARPKAQASPSHTDILEF